MTDEEKQAEAFIAWSREWTMAPDRGRRDAGEVPGVGVFHGPNLADAEARVDRILALWKQLVGLQGWERDVDELQKSKRPTDQFRLTPTCHYVRGDGGPDTTKRARAPEHDLEWRVLDTFVTAGLRSLDAEVIDAVNAVPLTKIRGGRTGNIEIDIVFLVKHKNGYSLQLVEAKHAANNAWFAVVEALRQLALFEASSETSAVRQLMCLRNPKLGLQASQLRAQSLVLAPRAFYESPDRNNPGQKQNAVAPAKELVARVSGELGVRCDLAVWRDEPPAITRW